MFTDTGSHLSLGTEWDLSAGVCERLLALAVLPSQAKLKQNQRCLTTGLTE